MKASLFVTLVLASPLRTVAMKLKTAKTGAMKLTEGLKEANRESVTENVDQTCHEVMEMVDNIQSNLFDEKREESIDLSESANKIDEINEAAFKKLLNKLSNRAMLLEQLLCS